MNSEALYQSLGALMAEMPDLHEGAITTDVRKWLGRAVALVEQTDNLVDEMAIKSATQNLSSVIRDRNAETILSVLHRVFARLELQLPVSSRGAFIPAGSTLDAFAAFAKVAGDAKEDLLVVDPYADAVILTDFLVSAPEGIKLRLMADKAYSKPTLKPAVERWATQFKDVRPLEVRIAPAKSLHDRLIFVDRKVVYSLGQSFNHLAVRAHTSLMKADDELAKMKIAAFEELWASATKLA